MTRKVGTAIAIKSTYAFRQTHINGAEDAGVSASINILLAANRKANMLIGAIYLPGGNGRWTTQALNAIWCVSFSNNGNNF